MSMTLSVIIPVYNVEKYLAECLDSVCSQTLKDIGIICIEDGVSGVLFPTGAAAALAALLTRPWSDDELASLGSSLHVRVVSRFTLSEMCSRTFGLFASLHNQDMV